MAGILNWNIVAERLESLGQNHQWLAEKLGVSENTISNWANGRRQIAMKYLYALADLLRLDIRQLLVPNKLSPLKRIPFPPDESE